MTQDASDPEPTTPAFPHRLPDGQWMFDWFSPHEFTAHACTRMIHQEKSPFQEIRILQTRDYGRCLVLSGEVQSYEADEFIYHEALVHPALLLHPGPRRVLVVGGGEGATLREVLRHASVDEAVMVDLDPRVVEAARAHLDTFHAGAFEDPRTRLEFGDGRAFMERDGPDYDAVFVDINNPLEESPSRRLFTREFYAAVRRRLAPGGVVVLQAGAATPLSLACPGTLVQTLRSVLPRVHVGLAYIPSFTANWTFILGGEDIQAPLDLSVEEVDQCLEARLTSGLRFYDGPTHQRMFLLPRYVREGLEEARPISTDDRPLVERYPGYTP